MYSPQALLFASALCAELAGPAAPALSLELSLNAAGQQLSGAAAFSLPAGVQAFDLARQFRPERSRLDGVDITPEAKDSGLPGITRWVYTLAHPGRLDIDYRGRLPAFSPEIDHRRVMQADVAMSNASWAWLPASGYWHPTPATGLSAYRIDVRPHQGLAVTAGRYQRLDDGRMRYELQAPVAGIDLLIGPYQRDSRTLTLPDQRTVEVNTYFTPDTLDLAPIYLSAAATHLQTYSEEIAPYPYPAFSIVASPLPSGFGMPALTWIGEQVLRLPFIPDTSLRHEILHNWWGNGVRVDYARGNWSEGLTSLMADYAGRLERDPSAGATQRIAWVRDLLAVRADEQVSLRDFQSRLHGRLAAVGYSKAAFLLWMIREEIGESAWRSGLKRLWSACQDRRARWDDVMAALGGGVRGPVLSHYQDWLERTRLPQLTLAAAQVSASEPHTVTLRIDQRQPVYALRVPIRVETLQGVEWHHLDVAELSSTHVLKTAAPARNVALDPDLRVLREPRPAELAPVLRNLVLAADAELILTAPGPAWIELATALAQGFFERPARVVEPLRGYAPRAGQNSLLIGTPESVQALLQDLGLEGSPPALLGADLDVAIWTLRDRRRGVIAVASAASADLLKPLVRRLAHYGGESYLGFRAKQIVVRGDWPIEPQQLRIEGVGRTPTAP